MSHQLRLFGKAALYGLTNAKYMQQVKPYAAHPLKALPLNCFPIPFWSVFICLLDLFSQCLRVLLFYLCSVLISDSVSSFIWSCLRLKKSRMVKNLRQNCFDNKTLNKKKTSSQICSGWRFEQLPHSMKVPSLKLAAVLVGSFHVLLVPDYYYLFIYMFLNINMYIQSTGWDLVHVWACMLLHLYPGSCFNQIRFHLGSWFGFVEVRVFYCDLYIL